MVFLSCDSNTHKFLRFLNRVSFTEVSCVGWVVGCGLGFGAWLVVAWA